MSTVLVVVVALGAVVLAGIFVGVTVRRIRRHLEEVV